MIRMLFAIAALVALSSEVCAGYCLKGTMADHKFCARCTTEQIGATARDEPCSHTFRIFVGHTVISSKVNTQAKNGRVSLSGTSYVYTPKKGFTGTDSFTIEWASLINQQLVVSFTQVNMSVGP